MRLGMVVRFVVTVTLVALAGGVSSGQTVTAERYAGTTVCADCSGIKTVLELYRDGKGAPSTFIMSESYIGKPAAGNRETNGTWTIAHGDATDKNAVVFQLHPMGTSSTTSFASGNYELRMLDGSLGELPASVPHTLKLVSSAITVVTEQTGGEISLKMGAELEVHLDANHTTGYSWVAATMTNPVVTSVGKATYQEHPARGKTGVGGTEVWRFKAVKAGKQALRFEYRKPWEKSVPAARTVTYQVTVQ
jgi:inhibitor of cysteine peptidase